jgi:hypothetical protein
MEPVSSEGSRPKRGGWCRRASIPIGLAIGLTLFPPFFCRAADEPLEYQVKAAFLLNFTKFTQWPATAFADADSPITICILGDDPFGNTLNQIVEGEVVSGRKVAVQRMKRPPQSKSCQVLFARKSENGLKVLPAVGHGVLTVGESAGFIRDGGMIAFVLENRRVRFEVNQTAAENAGLTLSSKLLNVAKTVER